MDIRLYNTLSHGVETFISADPPHVYMYNCGPTVYDYATSAISGHSLLPTCCGGFWN